MRSALVAKDVAAKPAVMLKGGTKERPKTRNHRLSDAERGVKIE